MIRQLRLRFTLVVIAVLVLVSAGIVLSIHFANERSIAAQAELALTVLAENSGARPAFAFRREDSGFTAQETAAAREASARETDLPDAAETREAFSRGRRRWDAMGQPPELRGTGDFAAGLSNFYTIQLTADGAVSSWYSDREDLYADEQVAALAERALAEGKVSGRIGTQFYRKVAASDGSRLIVLDARLDYLAASNTLRFTLLTAAAACVLLSLLAWLLVSRMLQPVEQAFIRQKQFVSDASHELKTPLAVISANAEVLEQEIGENENLGYIRSEVRRTDSLVRNLLALARLDRSEQAVGMARFDLSRALLDVVLPFESTVFEAGKTLETDIPEDIECTGNEEMVKQLAVILLSNALKYSDEHGRIEVSLTARGRQREIRVFNTGEPIPPENREKIFDRFWRGDPAHGRETGGHGLGLAIARSIVEIHRGAITVDAPEGGGTAFTVTLSA